MHLAGNPLIVCRPCVRGIIFKSSFNLDVDIVKSGTQLNSLMIQFTLYDEIKNAQVHDWFLKDKQVNEPLNFTVAEDGSVRFKGRWCVPNVSELKEKIIEEAFQHNIQCILEEIRCTRISSRLFGGRI